MTDEVKFTANAANSENRSLCWLFFNETGEKNICKVCSEEIYTTFGVPSDLRNHLRRKHGNLWKTCLETYLDDNNRRMDFPRNQDSKGIIPREIEKTLYTYSQISEVNKSTSGKSATVSKPTFKIESVQEVPMTIELSESPIIIKSEVIVEEIDSPPATEINPPPATEINPPPQTEINPPPQTETAMELSNTVKLPNKQTKTSSIREFTSNKKSHPVSQSSLHNRYKIPTIIPPNCLISGTSIDSGNIGQACDNFGIYIASLLKNLPCRRKAHHLQLQIINMILKERMSLNNR
ncbi:hypothetical protein CDAR_127221 [Caerostris darwini]|uniref:BED-type domain-containing protein n=1 Tax=Caerostris darwini TaxID=1538125 RepID=A0AAV4X811_9ARAC|nr:hypothetical protein CDAR_127221 [Caerostris darwini]